MKNNKQKNSILLALALLMIGGSFAFAQSSKTPENFIYLTWESDGMVPVEYQGKALPARFAIIKTSVQPFIYSSKSGGYLNSDQWTYRWYVNDNLIGEGQGLKSIRFRLKDFDKTAYTVKVSILTSVLSQPIEKTITINLAQPAIFFRVLGEKEILQGQYSTTGNLLQLEAVPFFFGGDDPNQLHYMWRINNERVSDLDNEQILILPKAEQGEKNYSIQLTIEDLRDIIIRASASININLK